MFPDRVEERPKPVPRFDVGKNTPSWGTIQEDFYGIRGSRPLSLFQQGVQAGLGDGFVDLRLCPAGGDGSNGLAVDLDG